MNALLVRPLIIPASLEDDASSAFRAMVELGNRMAQLDTGIDDLDDTAAQLLPTWLDQTDRIRRGFVARRDDEIVGAAELSTSRAPGTSATEIALMVLPDEMRTGVGQALLDRVETEALALGRRTVQSWSLHPVTPGVAPLVPATGWGAVARTPLARLLDENGYRLEQVERNSVLPLDGALADAQERYAHAVAFAGDDYRVVSWTLPTPPELRGGYGGMITRMATDVPAGDLVTEPEAWDAARVARRDEQILAGGQTLSVSAVVHDPTGDMVAFNELLIGADLTGITHQWGTLVAEEHRGRRLGTIAKCANLLRWQRIAPRSPKVSTFNAEENRPMLDINEAIGFVPASYAGGWQKSLR